MIGLALALASVLAAWEGGRRDDRQRAALRSLSREVGHPMVLSLYDYSGVWARPYLDQGAVVLLVDHGHPEGLHSIGPRLYTLGADIPGLDPTVFQGAEIVLAAPPCRVFCKPGAWLWQDWDTSGETQRELAKVQAVLTFVELLRPRVWALENPPGRLTTSLGVLGPPDYVFDPWWFGDPYTKRTYLWGRFQAPVREVFSPPTELVTGRIVDTLAGGDRRRSETPAGFARAFAAANPVSSRRTL